ncbi:pyruvate, water dikinase regulatory protein [Paenibacillus aurantius]|uniref:Putative pyruvate, phosphate dikinase regulatory protein n=1 Tax=Paenibacillus aurantius TaxID=2918900 RepID=A0AA96RCS3_9BACL|nr:pyruvate, water dikinase regulatory protein [Paenibacillus aurantius]WNQ09012.1 pyruvate, water dikinase regulatory protein [Paenibacillus aurantius]
MNKTGGQTVTICSDSIGDTADAVVQATLRQFDSLHVTVRRIGYVKQEDEIRALMEKAAAEGGFVAYTLVQPELREMMRAESIRLSVRAVDIMGPMMQAYVDTFHNEPRHEPGLLRKLDEEYYRRIEAIEFAVKSDDGRDTNAFLKADLVILGVSRTSKTPLSMFLAYTGVKTANLPIVPEVKLPDVLNRVEPGKLIGLTMDAQKLGHIRKERLQAVGLPGSSSYADLRRIVEELEYADSVFRRLGCRVIDVTHKAIEETASIIRSYL